ncbi:MAG: DNA cytosine methyltransferase [Roseiflexaceae bacterium]
MKRLTSIDLFAGAGGLSCGLEMAGFKTLFASDIHPVYCDTYQHNHPETYVYRKDIRDLPAEEVAAITKLDTGELDLLAGGPPCQGFSINAPIRTIEDRRNHLFLDFVRIAAYLMPKFILIENVPGMVSLDNGGVIAAIIREITNLGYKVDYRILFAAHYGVPQIRYRTIFLANRLDVEIEFPYPTHNAKSRPNFTRGRELTINILPLFASELKPHTTVWDAISDLPPIESGISNDKLNYISEPQNEYQELMRAVRTNIANHQAGRLSPINLERLRYIPQGGSWRDIPFDLLPAGMKRARRSDHTKRYGRLDPQGLCSTVLTKCDPHWGSFFHPTQDRVLSVREAARMQSFPDNYVFFGKLVHQYEQVGNAVPPLLARAIGQTIAKSLIEEKDFDHATSIR